MYQFLKIDANHNIYKNKSKMGNSNTNTCPFEDKQFMDSLKKFQEEANRQMTLQLRSRLFQKIP